MNIEEGIREIKKDSGVIEMVLIVLEHKNIGMYVEAMAEVRLS